MRPENYMFWSYGLQIILKMHAHIYSNTPDCYGYLRGNSKNQFDCVQKRCILHGMDRYID